MIRYYDEDSIAKMFDDFVARGYIEPPSKYPHIEIDEKADLIDRKEALKHFTNLSQVYCTALIDCDLEKEVYPHYEALLRGKKAVMDMTASILRKIPKAIEVKNGQK